MRQPSQVIEKIDMVTCTVGIQTSCPSSPSYTHSNILAKVETTCPSHFTEIHITKLEDAFSKRQKPDEIQLQILAMECNLLYKDVRVSPFFPSFKRKSYHVFLTMLTDTGAS